MFSPSHMGSAGSGRNGALRIAAIYAVVAGLWVLFSDELLGAFVPEPRLFARISIFKGWLFVLVTALLLYLLIRHYLLAIRAKDEKLQTIVQGVSAVTGEEFFATLAKHVAVTLAVDYAFVGELSDEEPLSMRTIAVFGNGAPQENFTYSLAGTPCAEVIRGGGKGCYYPAGVSRRFPGDNMLTRMEVEGYIGTPLRDAAGRTLGIMAALNRQPIADMELAESLFHLFAERAAAELERRQADRELREAALKYRIVADNTSNWEFWVDPHGKFIYTSPSCQRITGHSPDEFLVDPDLLHRMLHADDKVLMENHNHDMRSDGNLGEVEFRIVHADGGLRWLHHVCQPMFDDTGTFLGRRGSNIDITARKEAEDALRTQFDQISTIFDALNALVYVSDLASDELLYLNRYGTSLFGEGWRGKKCYEVLQSGQAGVCSFCTNDRLVRDGKPQPPCIWEFQSPLTGRWFQCTDRAIQWPDGRLVRLEIAVDISERKEMERMKDEIISAVSHEMRTPLTAMIGFTELLLETAVNPAQQRSYISTIHKETLRLNELIANFLDLQQMRARLITYRFEAVPVLRLLQDAAAVFAFDQERHPIVIDCPESLPPLRGDEARLHQVMTNLLSNAIKYSPPESTVSVGARSEGPNVLILVQDEGCGIPTELCDKIFDKFFRLDNTDRRPVGGTGLGLTLVRELVAAHGGRVWVESTVGKGSTFYVSLPVMDTAGEQRPSGHQE